MIGSFALPGAPRILEIGSGTGGNLAMLSQYGRVTGVEMDATAREMAAEKTDRIFDIRDGVCPNAMPFKSGESFDLICLFDVLEHIEDDIAALSSLKGLLTDGGTVLVTVPAYRWLWSTHDLVLHHKRRYTSRELKHKLRGLGFNVLKISYFNTLLFPFIGGARLLDRLLGRETASGTSVPPTLINSALFNIFSLERFFLHWLKFPFGVSILVHFQAE